MDFLCCPPEFRQKKTAEQEEDSSPDLRIPPKFCHRGLPQFASGNADERQIFRKLNKYLLSIFIADPDSDITEIKLIEPSDYKRYFDWGEIGDRIMDRALWFKDLYHS